MIKIALCDDENNYRKVVKETIKGHNIYQESFEFYEYNSGESLLAEIDIMHEVIFLDIHMTGIDGNRTASLLREKNSNAILIFCTNYEKPTPNSFKVQPFRYILKDLENKMLNEEIRAIMHEIHQRVTLHHLVLVSDGGMIKIDISEVQYIARHKHGSMVYTYSEKNGEQEYRSKDDLNKHYQSLKCLGFEFPHYSYIVNLANIKQVKKTVLVLENGKELNISRSKKEKFDKKLMAFIKMRYRRK